MGAAQIKSDAVVNYRLRIGRRRVLLVQGPEGWGESSLLEGYPCSSDLAYQCALSAACIAFPVPLRSAVMVNALVSKAPADTSALAGFPAVKVKVGRADLASDLELVRQVRQSIGPDVALRVDANGAWDLETAVEALHILEPLDLELAEQPVASIEDLARLRRRVSVRLAADECVRSTEDARLLRRLGAVDVLVLKVQPLGGIAACLAVAEAAGLPTLVSSMMETSVGLAAGAALAAALPTHDYACGLATLAEIDGDVTDQPLTPDQGMLVPRRVAPTTELLERYAEAGE